ncbi:MAG: VWA domain-containing protein [Actinomycetota bacterium]|nr:VWA domain-containing protein [Actinomycetota bacterium]
MVEQIIALAERLRGAGLDVATSEVIDAARALEHLDLADRTVVRECLRAAMVKEADPIGSFDRCFDATFRPGVASAEPAVGGSSGVGFEPLSTASGLAGSMDDEVLQALMSGDADALASLARQAVEMYGGGDGDDAASERRLMHRVLRAIDLSRMLSAAMQQLRRSGDHDDFELMLRRNELSELIEEFRRKLAAEIARQLDAATPTDAPTIPERTSPEDIDLLQLSRTEYDELRRVLQPLLRKMAARIGQKRKLRSTGRLDVRRTIRRSLQSGGVPMEVVQRRRHPHRPDVVVLCDVSGSVAEFAQFTFSLMNALHAEVRKVRSFAFVDGVAEVTDVFQEARHDIAVNRLVERRGVVGLDGHSDYGAVFSQFATDHLEDAVGSGTTVIISGDARSNYRDGGVDPFERIAERARRVYWLNPEPCELWGTTDSLIDTYRHGCTAVHEVRTLGQLADVIAELI